MKKHIFALHILFILFLTIYTSIILNSNILPIYLLMASIFLANTLFSLNTILKFPTGIFYYLLNIMFLLGFWFKFSVQKITNITYREPIGTFILNADAEIRVLWVIIVGMAGFLVAQLASFYLFKKYQNDEAEKQSNDVNIKALIMIILSAVALAAINVKFNILLFAFKPGLILPFKGNAIYFLILTRGMIFLFLYYCLKTYSNKMVIWGAFVAAICSIGVLSRMVILSYFAVVFFLVIQNITRWHLKKSIQSFLIIVPTFFIFSYLTVLLSTGLREKLMRESSASISTSTQVTEAAVKKDFELHDKFKMYKELALGRWIGMEGVLAVDSYPHKSFTFLMDALKEKSYHGNSFYTQVASPELYNSNNTSQVISTSVPGPIAFFYYSGSIWFVFLATLVVTFLFSVLEQFAFKFFIEAQSVGIFISTFIVFDFFQFGISPLAFLRYLSFSVISIFVFYILTRKHNKLI